MRRIRVCLQLTLVAIAGIGPIPAFAAIAPTESTDQDSLRAERALLRNALINIQNSESAEAAMQLRQVIEASAFDELSASEQRVALSSAAEFAYNDEDYSRAFDLSRRASVIEGATADHWVLRVNSAWAAHKDEDAVFSFTTLVRDFPVALSRFSDRAVHFNVDSAKKFGDARYQLLDALYTAHWKIKDGNEPEDLWQDLARLKLERKLVSEADAVVGRITSPKVLIGMRVDKRFASIVKNNPSRFDIDRAATERIRVAREAASAMPRKIDAQMSLTSTLLGAGQFEEALRIADEVIGKVRTAEIGMPAYDDMDRYLWMFDSRARALVGLGRPEEGAESLRRGLVQPENGRPNVSLAINLGALLNDLARPTEALAAIEDVKNVSPFGRMQLEYVRLGAALQMDNPTVAEATLAFMREHRADAIETFQMALLSAGKTEEAAALLVERLNDAELRSDALLDVQMYPETPRFPKFDVAGKQLRSVLARSDVQAAIKRYGKIESFNYRIDWF